VGCALRNGVHTGGVTDTDPVSDAASPDSTFDALMLLSFGGPNGPDDVMPFLRNVTAGRNVPDERLAVVAEQYELFGGRRRSTNRTWR
jgi:protoheme ferro-lyase